ncbi:MAG: sigma-70 family RNA polymerase sigma factor [Gemmataceae bacterium]
MRKYAQGLVGSAMRAQVDADDIVQSTLLTLWLGVKAGKFKAPTIASLAALVRMLLRRQVARYWRKAKTQPKLIQNVQDPSTCETVEYDIEPTSKESSGPLQKAQFEDMLDNFLGELSETDKILVQLRFRGFTTTDAGQLLELDPGLLRMRLIRLREKFADLRRDLSC